MLIGLVGKASTGKSTLFKAATLAEVDIASYPFTTIKPNHAVGFVRVECADKFFKVQCNPRTGYCLRNNRFVPIDLLDVAGLVPGAHEGKGMGNQFLDDLNQADALIHVIDVSGSTNEKGEEVSPGSYDPANDVRFLETELDMWYLRLIKKGWDRFTRQIQQENQAIEKAIAKHLSSVRVTEDIVKSLIKQMSLPDKLELWTDDVLLKVAREIRKITKPMIIAANKCDVAQGFDNYKRLVKEFSHLTIIPCSAESELVLKQAAKQGLIEYIPGDKTFNIIKDTNEKQKIALEFIKKSILDVYGSTGVQDVLNYSVFKLLNYIAIFPGGLNKLGDSEGRILPDCFLMPPSSTALSFAYKLHTDLGDKFIRAIDVKKRLTIGKDYALKMGDVIEIVSGR